MLKKNPLSFNGHCYAFIGKDIILKDDDTPLSYEDLKVLQKVANNDIWHEPEYDLCTLLTKSDSIPMGYKRTGVRKYAYDSNEQESLLIFRARAIAIWTDDTRYCQHCGRPLEAHTSLTALQCNACGNTVFPRINPCVIVLVNKGNRILLAQHTQRDRKMYACLAGFMEVGENAEQAVRREVFEETGLTIKNLKYFGTQSWPFPSQMMIAYTAEWESGELKLQEDELYDAMWLTAEEATNIPAPGSIAYEMISDFIRRNSVQ